MYTGSKASYESLTALKAYLTAFSTTKAIKFEVNYLFPWKYYDMANPTGPRPGYDDCYAMDSYCSIGFVDCSLCLTQPPKD